MAQINWFDLANLVLTVISFLLFRATNGA